MTMHVYEGLTRYDRNYNVEPALARAGRRSPRRMALQPEKGRAVPRRLAVHGR